MTYNGFQIVTMKCTLLVIALVFAFAVSQEYSMGTKAQPKADLPVDDKLIIQDIANHLQCV